MGICYPIFFSNLISGPWLFIVFSLEIYGHIIGMFELNNLYVSVCNPSISFFHYMCTFSRPLNSISKYWVQFLSAKFCLYSQVMEKLISNLCICFSGLVVASPVEDYFLYIDELPSPYKVGMHVFYTFVILIASLDVYVYHWQEKAEEITRPLLDALGDSYSICCQGMLIDFK